MDRAYKMIKVKGKWQESKNYEITVQSRLTRARKVMLGGGADMVP